MQYRSNLATARGVCCRYLFSQTGIKACSYNMKKAGVYTIVLSVTNSRGLSASVNRTLVVQPVCPSGESLCSNKVITPKAPPALHTDLCAEPGGRMLTCNKPFGKTVSRHSKSVTDHFIVSPCAR